MKKYIIIPRTDKAGAPVLVLPDDYPPYLGYYSPSTGHGGMAHDYYRKATFPPNQAALKLAKDYASDIPGACIMRRLHWRARGRA